jgi:hypothetical protein
LQVSRAYSRAYRPFQIKPTAECVRSVSIGLLDSDLIEVDRLVTEARSGGQAKANRSSVIRDLLRAAWAPEPEVTK